MPYEPHVMQIHDLRPIQSELGLDVQGFALKEQRSAVRDFWDDDEVRRVYYPEAEAFLKQVTGASRVFIFDHLQRRRVAGAQGPRARRAAPAGDPGACRPHRPLGAAAGARPDGRRGRGTAEGPGAGHQYVAADPRRAAARRAAGGVRLAHASQSGDLVPSDLVYRDRVGETYSVKYNPAHTWFYVPEMRRDEALLLKIADTKTDISARFMPHTSFTDPTTPADAAPRQSIELRTLVFHPA